MRRKIVIANWKMNTSIDTAVNLIIDIKNGIEDNYTILCVPYTHLGTLQEFADDRIGVGAQNLCQFDNGAYTGEISGEILNSLGVEFVIIGHSERRKFFAETNEIVNAKVHQAINQDIVPIICCGENLELRKEGNYLPFIKEQVKAALKDIGKDDAMNCIIAYEPIWAIGTGETASAAQAQEVHSVIRNELKAMYDNELAEHLSIVYGGSVNESNAKALFSTPDIDGALVGGASLNATSFLQILKSI